MALLEEELNEETSYPYRFIWQCQTNSDPWDRSQTIEWTPYPDHISKLLEEAYQCGLEDVLVNEKYRVSLKYRVQQHVDDPYKQRPVQRRRRYHPCLDNCMKNETNEEFFRQERLSSSLESGLRPNSSNDIRYYGSPFIQKWLLLFSKGELSVTFNRIFPALVQGLIKEGKIYGDQNLFEIELVLRIVERQTDGLSSKERINKLQECCAKLYTKECYIYRVVNTALCHDDQTKLSSLGPYCYLLFSYIGRRIKDDFSMRNHLEQVFKSKKKQPLTVYRGDRVSDDIIEQYRKATGDRSKRFKWLSFVSTSWEQDIAEKFAIDVLYTINIRSYSSSEDRFRELMSISNYKNEKEVLLLPGVLFHIENFDYDFDKGLYLINIEIHSSYISQLH